MAKVNAENTLIATAGNSGTTCIAFGALMVDEAPYVMLPAKSARK